MPDKVGQIGSKAFDFGMGNFSGYMPYFFYVFLTLIFVFFVLAIFWLLNHKIKASVITLYGSGSGKKLSTGKEKYNRFRWNKQKTAWLPLFPLFSKKEYEPFPPELIYPGNKVYAFKLGEEIIPGCLEISQDEEKNLQCQINPVPHYIRNWQSMEHKKNAEEFQKQSFWEQNKHFIMTIVTVLACLAAFAVTIYMSYKFAAGGRIDAEAINSLADAFKNYATIK